MPLGFEFLVLLSDIRCSVVFVCFLTPYRPLLSIFSFCCAYTSLLHHRCCALTNHQSAIQGYPINYIGSQTNAVNCVDVFFSADQQQMHKLFLVLCHSPAGVFLVRLYPCLETDIWNFCFYTFLLTIVSQQNQKPLFVLRLLSLSEQN